MIDRRTFDYAVIAEKTRARIRRQGHVAGRLLWTRSEDEILKACYPDLKLAHRKLPRRTYGAVRYRAQSLGIQRKRHVWKTTEISLMKKLFRSAEWPEIRAAFPFATRFQINAVAKHYGIRRAPRVLAKTPHPIIDAIRQRCCELGYSMPDLDDIAKTGTYFQKAGWHGCRPYSPKHVVAAINALDGSIIVRWNS